MKLAILLTLLLLYSVSVSAQLSLRSQGTRLQADPKRKTKVELKYDKSKNLTRVWLSPLSIWEGLSKSDSVDIVVSFTYPGHTIVTPKTVLLEIYGSNDHGIEFDPEPKLVFIIDDVRLDLGKMRMIRRMDDSRGEYHLQSFQAFDRSIAYDDFVRIAKADKVKI